MKKFEIRPNLSAPFERKWNGNEGRREEEILEKTSTAEVTKELRLLFEKHLF